MKCLYEIMKMLKERKNPLLRDEIFNKILNKIMLL